MENKDKEPIIYKNKALKDLKGIKDVLTGQGDPILAAIINRAIEAIESQDPVENAEVITYCYECNRRDTMFCPMFHSGGPTMPKNSGYCAYGKLRSLTGDL